MANLSILTPREMEVLFVLFAGLGKPSSAKELFSVRNFSRFTWIRSAQSWTPRRLAWQQLGPRGKKAGQKLGKFPGKWLR